MTDKIKDIRERWSRVTGGAGARWRFGYNGADIFEIVHLEQRISESIATVAGADNADAILRAPRDIDALLSEIDRLNHLLSEVKALATEATAWRMRDFGYSNDNLLTVQDTALETIAQMNPASDALDTEVYDTVVQRLRTKRE